MFDRWDALLPLRLSLLRRDPIIDLLGAGSTIHGDPVGMVGWRFKIYLGDGVIVVVIRNLT